MIAGNFNLGGRGREEGGSGKEKGGREGGREGRKERVFFSSLA
jgi:hypothetical protein